MLRLSRRPICVQPQPAYYQYAPPQYYQVSALPTLPPGKISRADACMPPMQPHRQSPCPAKLAALPLTRTSPPPSHRMQAYPGGYAPAGAPPPGHPAYGVPAQGVPVPPPGAAGMPPPAAYGVPPAGTAAGPAAAGVPAGAVPAAAADAPDFDHMSVGDLKQFIASRGAKLEVGACWGLAAVASAAAAGTTAAAAASGCDLPQHAALLMSSRLRVVAAAAAAWADGDGGGSWHGAIAYPHLPAPPVHHCHRVRLRRPTWLQSPRRCMAENSYGNGMALRIPSARSPAQPECQGQPVDFRSNVSSTFVLNASTCM